MLTLSTRKSKTSVVKSENRLIIKVIMEMRENVKNGQSLWSRVKINKMSYMMLAPYFLLFFIFTVVPVIMSVFLSFTYYNIFELPRFLFLENYRRLLINDDVFLLAVKNTLIIAAILGPVSYTACFLLAWMINEFKPRFRALLTTVFYMPSIAGAAYLIWQIMFSSDSYGFINAALMNTGIIRAPVLWLEDPRYILTVVIIVSVWMGLGTSFLAFIAGLQNVDRSLYEAGRVDGVNNRFQELWYITLPSMRPQLMFGAVMQITAAFGVGEVSANLAGFPSVDYAAHTVINHINDYGFIRFDMGYACAIATLLFFAMVAVNRAIQSLLKRVGT